MTDEITKHSMVDDYPYATYSFAKDSAIHKPLNVEIDNEDNATTNFTYNQILSIFDSGIAPIVKTNANGQTSSGVILETFYDSVGSTYVATFNLFGNVYGVFADDPDELMGYQTLI